MTLERQVNFLQLCSDLALSLLLLKSMRPWKFLKRFVTIFVGLVMVTLTGRAFGEVSHSPWRSKRFAVAAAECFRNLLQKRDLREEDFVMLTRLYESGRSAYVNDNVQALEAVHFSCFNMNRGLPSRITPSLRIIHRLEHLSIPLDVKKHLLDFILPTVTCKGFALGTTITMILGGRIGGGMYRCVLSDGRRFLGANVTFGYGGGFGGAVDFGGEERVFRLMEPNMSWVIGHQTFKFFSLGYVVGLVVNEQNTEEFSPAVVNRVPIPLLKPLGIELGPVLAYDSSVLVRLPVRILGMQFHISRIWRHVYFLRIKDEKENFSQLLKFWE